MGNLYQRDWSKIRALGDNQPFLFYYPVTQEYFTVYTGNSFLIGQIDNNDLRKAIITSYTKARGLIDSYRFNNDLLQKYEYWSFLYQESQNSLHATNRASHSLDELSERGHVVPELSNPNIRELFIKEYRLIHSIEESRVVILGLIHGRRDLKTLWKKEQRKN